MAPFDAELYLRLLGERELIGRGRGAHNGRTSDLVEAARALLHVGAIEYDVAAEVTAGYSLAAGLREGRGLWRRNMIAAQARSAAGSGSAPAERRMVVCAAKLERPTEEIQVRAVTLTEAQTNFSVTIRERAGSSSARQGRVRRGPMAPHRTMSYVVTDDRGGRFSTSIGSGGGNDQGWRGRLSTDKPLPLDAAWIEFDGERIELVDAPNPCTITVEPVPESDAARRYVWFWLASADAHSQQGADVVIDALLAAGSLRSDDPEIEVMREIGGGNLRHRGWAPVTAPAAAASAPPEWRSWLQRKAGRPAGGIVAFHAVTPAFDGYTVTVSELEADEDGWELQFDVSPGILIGPFRHSLDEGRIAWWAVDDLGQHYLGQTGQASGGPDETTGTLQFHPSIDRRAKTLTLLPTGPSERARIEVPLAWGPA